MPGYPIRSGTFTLPATGGAARRLAGVTVTNTGAQPATVTIADPTGAPIWSCALDPGGSCRVGGLVNDQLPAGDYTVSVTGTVTGTLTTRV